MIKKQVIDLFSGAGGFSTGFKQAGFSIRAAIELDKGIAPTYRYNHPETNLYTADIEDVVNKKLLEGLHVDIVIGGPPCQGFSMAGARIRGGFVDDPRNYLFKAYCDILRQTKPKVFVFENVKGILSSNKGRLFSEIIKTFTDKDNFDGSSYNVYYKIFKAVDFGIPQKRERVFIVGVLDKEIDFDKYFEKTTKKIKNIFPDYFETISTWDAISDLSTQEDAEVVSDLVSQTNYQKYLQSNNKETFNHTKPRHSDIAQRRMSLIKEGENWKVLPEKINSVHSGAYGRLKKGDPSPTITTRFATPSGGCFIHPVENRTLSPREGARIQSFPDSFKFLGNKTSIYKQIGNAVPPKISFFIANMVSMILSDEYAK